MKHYEDADTMRYRSCVWMTEALREACAEQVEIMFRALTLGQKVQIENGEYTIPGFQYAPRDKVYLSVGNTFVTGKNLIEAECKMLGLILADSVGYPLFRKAFDADIDSGN